MEYSLPFMTLENFPTRSLVRSTSVVTGEILAKTPLVKEESPDTASLITLLATEAETSLERLLVPSPAILKFILHFQGVLKSKSGSSIFQSRSALKCLLDPLASAVMLFFRKKALASRALLGSLPCQVILGSIQLPSATVTLVLNELSVRV